MPAGAQILKESRVSETKCPKCGKKIAGENRGGSLTGYLFKAFDCNCGASDQKLFSKADNGNEFCPVCGLVIAAESKDGSLTGFLFQSTRCKCAKGVDFNTGKMSSKFWKLKAGNDTIFVQAGASEKKLEAPLVGLKAGATIGGVYEIIELIGRGGMGEVYLARHQGLAKKCALKVIPPEQVTEMGWQRFQLEAKAVAKLDHINLVRVTDLGIHDGCLPFFAMDYVNGKNLADLVAEQGPMPLKTMLDVFKQVCDGLDFAHRHGILHRDLKPANIMMVVEPGGARTAKVLDFGLAKLTGHDRDKQSLTAVGDVFGSPFYMSPEQCNGEKLDNRSDIYSLGCAMFECLTGRPPFVGSIASAVLFSQQEADPPSLESIVGAGKFPASLEIVLAKMLRKNPVERYQTCRELKADLERVERGEAVLPFYATRRDVAAPAKNFEREAGQKSNSLLSVAAFAVVLLVLGLGAVAALLFNQPKPPVVNYEVKEPEGFPLQAGEPFLRGREPSLNGPVLIYGFPEQSIGNIFLDGGKPIPCRDEVKFQLGSWVTFQPDTKANFNSETALRFRSNDFDELMLNYDPAVFKDPKKMTSLRSLQLLTGLKAVTISALDEDWIDPFDQVLPILEKLPAIRTLKIEGQSAITPQALAKSKLLDQLEFLSIHTNRNITAVLEKLKAANKIVGLRLRSTDLNDADCRLIASLKGLRSLELLDCEFPKESIHLISQSPNLRNLTLQNGNLDSRAAGDFLSNLQKHGLLTASLSSPLISKEELIVLEKACPYLCFAGQAPGANDAPDSLAKQYMTLSVADRAKLPIAALLLRTIHESDYGSAFENKMLQPFVNFARFNTFDAFVVCGPSFKPGTKLWTANFKGNRPISCTVFPNVMKMPDFLPDATAARSNNLIPRHYYDEKGILFSVSQYQSPEFIERHRGL